MRPHPDLPFTPLPQGEGPGVRGALDSVMYTMRDWCSIPASMPREG